MQASSAFQRAPTTGPLRGLIFDPKTNTTRIGVLPPAGEKAKTQGCVSFTILNKELVREFDPLIHTGDAFVLPGISEATTIRDAEGVDLFSLAPTDAEPTLDVPLDIYEAIVASAGTDPLDDASDEWNVEGHAAMQALLLAWQGMPPSQGLPLLRGCAEARLRLVEAEGRWHLMPPAEIERVTGRPYTSRKALRKTGGKAFALSLAKAGEEAEAARVAEEARVREEAAKTPNSESMAALGLVGLAVPRDGFTQLPLAMTYPLPVRFAGQQDRMPVVFPVYTDRSATDFYCWRAIEGLPLPAEGSIAGCSIISPDTVLPVAPRGRLEAMTDPPVDALYNFTVQLRRRFLPDIDRGPVTSWSKSGVDRAREIAKEYAPLFRKQRDPLRRMQLAHGIFLAVRGLKVSPVRVIATFIAAIAELKVDAGDGVRAEVERMALDAAQGGEIGVGSLLNSKETSKKKNVKEGI